MRIFRRGDVWHAWWYTPEGRREQRSTRCHDKRAAEEVARRWERDAADPAHAAARDATLTGALSLLLEDRKRRAAAGLGSLETLEYYRQKAGHWVRVLEHDASGAYVPLRLTSLSASLVDEYLHQRRSESATEHTLHKELVTLRASLKLAKRRGQYLGDLGAVLPIGHSPAYVPRTRWLAPDELQRVLAQLDAGRAACVAFIVATGARWGEAVTARRADVAADHAEVLLRGTKTKAARRVVPIPSRAARELLAYALEHADGADYAAAHADTEADPGLLFAPWGNVIRDLKAACKRAQIPTASPNDLRRTCATWLRASGATPDLIGTFLGHTTSVMAERVYAQLSPSQLGERIRVSLGESAGGLSAGVAGVAPLAGPARLLAPPASEKAAAISRLSSRARPDSNGRPAASKAPPPPSPESESAAENPVRPLWPRPKRARAVAPASQPLRATKPLRRRGRS